MTKIVPKIFLNNIEFLSSDSNQKKDILTFIEEWNNNSEFIEIKTSGSTGKAKSLKFKKKYLIESANATMSYFKDFSTSPIIVCLSANTIGGKMQIIRSLVWNKKLIVLPLNRNPLKDLNKKSSFVTLTPIQLKEILKINPEKLDFIENILLGSAPIDNDLFVKIQNVKTNIFHGFGMSETLSHFAVRKLNKINKKVKLNEIPYTLLKEVEITFEENYFYLNIPYLDIYNLKLNEDLKIIDNNNFLWLGRKDWLINSGGYKFNPEILESKISKLIKYNFFIIGEKNDEFYEIITLYIEDINTQINIDKIYSFLKLSLEKYEIPKKIYTLGKFIYTESGKVNRLLTQKFNLEKQK